MSKQVLTTSKMPGETEQQYTAWLLYCDAGSLDKLHRLWEGLHQDFTEIAPEIAALRGRLGSVPVRRTLAYWSKKYCWVERKDLKLTEDLVGIRKRSKEITQKKLGIIGELMWEKFQGIKRQIKKGEIATVDEAKKLWEMFRTEMGESLGKHELNINENEQQPPSEQEMAGIEDISREFKEFYEQRRRPGKKTGNLLDRKKQDKK